MSARCWLSIVNVGGRNFDRDLVCHLPPQRSELICARMEANKQTKYHFIATAFAIDFS